MDQMFSLIYRDGVNYKMIIMFHRPYKYNDDYSTRKSVSYSKISSAQSSSALDSFAGIYCGREMLLHWLQKPQEQNVAFVQQMFFKPHLFKELHYFLCESTSLFNCSHIRKCCEELLWALCQHYRFVPFIYKPTTAIQTFSTNLIGRSPWRRDWYNTVPSRLCLATE